MKVYITLTSGNVRVISTPPIYERKFITFQDGDTVYRYPYANILEIKEVHE